MEDYVIAIVVIIFFCAGLGIAKASEAKKDEGQEGGLSAEPVASPANADESLRRPSTNLAGSDLAGSDRVCKSCGARSDSGKSCSFCGADL
jgi:hypothetical protein